MEKDLIRQKLAASACLKTKNMTEKDWDFIREQMPKMEPLSNKAYDFDSVLGSSKKYASVVQTP